MDLVRVLCVVVVVIGHMLMIGAAVVPGRGLVIERTLLETSWIGRSPGSRRSCPSSSSSAASSASGLAAHRGLGRNGGRLHPLPHPAARAPVDRPLRRRSRSACS
jgi:hypothetical protein